MGPEERKNGSRGSLQKQSPDMAHNSSISPELPVAVPALLTSRACYGTFFGGPVEMGMDFVCGAALPAVTVGVDVAEGADLVSCFGAGVSIDAIAGDEITMTVFFSLILKPRSGSLDG